MLCFQVEQKGNNMFLFKELSLRLKRSQSEFDGANFVSISEVNPKIREIASEILDVIYIPSKAAFEASYVADFLKTDDESDESYQLRLSRLNESRIIPAIEKTTQKRFIFVTDPTKQEMDGFVDLPYGIVSYETYKEIVGIASSLSIHFDEEESMPVFIRRVLRYAHEEKASDIDLTSMHATVSIKFKISGEWTEPVGAFPIAWKNFFMTALCSMASPSSVDYRSGKELKFRISTNVEGVDMSYRASILPTAFGENVALRKLPGIGGFPKLEDLGLSSEAIDFIDAIVEQIESPKKGGVVFITGETGSGKSTLLSAIEGEYLKKQKKVSTSEDPVENKHPHPFLNQTEVGEDAGITHMDALSGFLRQNSDVIVIGECRRSEELIAVINAGLSGHYTFTTMHTGSPEETLTRLSAMGVDLNMLSGVLRGIISMTLLPRLCAGCKQKRADGYYVRGMGCAQCKGRGTNGVIPVGEFSKFSPETKKMIGDKKPYEVFEAVKEKGDFISLASQIDKLKELGLVDAGVSNV